MNGASAKTSTWRVWVRWPVFITVCVSIATIVWQLTFGYSASANDTLTALAGIQSPPHGLIGRVIRLAASALGGGDFGLFAAWWQLALAAVMLLLAVTVSRLAGHADRAIFVVFVLACTAAGRGVLGTFSAESILAVLSLAACVAIGGMARFPRIAALALGGIGFVMVLAHPIGMPALIPILVVAGMFPRPRSPRPATETFATRATWLPWFAAVCVCGGLLLVTLPGDRIKVLWDTMIGLLRTTTAAPRSGWATDIPLFGPALAALLSLPLVIVVLATEAAVRSWRKSASEPLAIVSSIVAAWLLTAGVIGRPTPGPVAIEWIVAPLVSVLAVDGLLRWVDAIRSSGHSYATPAAVVLALSVCASAALDTGATRDDTRTVLARKFGVFADPSADRPARLDSADIAVLRAHPSTTAVLPEALGGNALARRLGHLGLVPKQAVYVRPFAAKSVLLHMPTDNPIAAAWVLGRERIDCDAGGRSCLIALKRDPAPNPDAAGGSAPRPGASAPSP